MSNFDGGLGNILYFMSILYTKMFYRSQIVIYKVQLRSDPFLFFSVNSDPVRGVIDLTGRVHAVT